MLRLIVAAIAGFVTFFPAFRFLRKVIDPSLAGAPAFAIALVGVPSVILMLWKSRDPTQIAASKGVLERDEHIVVSAVEIEELEDEGRHFFLKLASGATLFLSGQYLYGVCDSGAFPNSRIIVQWDRESGFTLSIQCLGKPLAPTLVLKPFSDAFLELGDVPRDRAVFSEPIDMVVSRYS